MVDSEGRSVIPGYLQLMPDAPPPAAPLEGRWKTWRWKRARRKLEYELFVQAGIWGSVQWNIVKRENDVLRVYEGRWNRAPSYPWKGRRGRNRG